MIQIKFRAHYQGKVYRVCLIDWDSGTVELEIAKGDVIVASILAVDLLQFTGLLDKNGKEIYEGDIANSPFPIYEQGTSKILEWGIEPGLVAWQHEFAQFVVEFLYCTEQLCIEDEYEVIGNKYENPDLLNP